MSVTFEHRDLAGTLFHDVNLGGAVFRDVNLGGAIFENVNLDSAVFKGNLKNVRIEDSNITGLTVFGYRLDELIEAEEDRRAPERLRLKMGDIYDPASVCTVLARLEEIRAAFRQRLRAAEPGLLAQRPSPGEWSAIECVRHMLFAEDLYLNRFILQNDKPWNPLGLLPDFLAHWQGYDAVGGQASSDLETVLAAWDAVHADTLVFLADLSPEKLHGPATGFDNEIRTVGDVLQLLARHDLGHIRQGEAALARLA